MKTKLILTILVSLSSGAPANAAWLKIPESIKRLCTESLSSSAGPDKASQIPSVLTSQESRATRTYILNRLQEEIQAIDALGRHPGSYGHYFAPEKSEFVFQHERSSTKAELIRTYTPLAFRIPSNPRRVLGSTHVEIDAGSLQPEDSKFDASSLGKRGSIVLRFQLNEEDSFRELVASKRSLFDFKVRSAVEVLFLTQKMADLVIEPRDYSNVVDGKRKWGIEVRVSAEVSNDGFLRLLAKIIDRIDHEVVRPENSPRMAIYF